MLQELMSIFRQGNPLKELADHFSEMLRITQEMTVTAGDMFFRKEVAPDARTEIYVKDIRVNKLERTIRKNVVSHLSISGNTPDLPYCLLLMSQVKDVERLGDYAKNLTEIPDLYSGPLDEDGVLAELRAVRTSVEEIFGSTAPVFAADDRERALALIRMGKDLGKRADGLLVRIAQADYNAGQTTSLVLGSRYYKRINGHILNVLSSVVMPLHKVDYYDEKELARQADELK